MLKALRDIGDPHAVDAVLDVARSASEALLVRAEAAQVLLSFGDRRGVTTLASLLDDPDAKHHSYFREWALPLLLEANGTEALPALRAARSEVGVLERRRLDRAIQTLEQLDRPQGENAELGERPYA